MTEQSAEAAGDDGDGSAGFFIIDPGGAIVDLTEVVGEMANGVFEGELEAGGYTKIELYVANVDGVVDGEDVSVKVPSGRLQIIKSFQVGPGDTVSYVFAINVVKKGQSAEYNLLPVSARSGVAGEDVEGDGVGRGDRDNEDGSAGEGDDDDETAETEAEDEPGSGAGGESGPPDDAGNAKVAGFYGGYPASRPTASADFGSIPALTPPRDWGHRPE